MFGLPLQVFWSYTMIFFKPILVAALAVASQLAHAQTDMPAQQRMAIEAVIKDNSKRRKNCNGPPIC